MTTESEIRKSFTDQALGCGKLGSPFMEKLLRGLGKQLTGETETGQKILSWQGPPDATGDAVALRLAGGLHALVRSGALPALAPFYQPDADFDEKELVDAALAAISEKDKELLSWLDFAPQTNEVRRASVIYAGLMAVVSNLQQSGARRFPIALYELGASGGLNLQLDNFAYTFRGLPFGDRASLVRLSPDWRGPLPFRNSFRVVSRKGCDLNPLHVEREEDRARLLAYLWPDQSERLERTRAAMDLAVSDPPVLDRAPAEEWVERMLEEDRDSQNIRVFFHTIAWQYFPQSAQERIAELMEMHGKKATSKNPLAWLSFEMVENKAPELTLQMWPGGKKKRLAAASPHVDWIEWFE